MLKSILLSLLLLLLLLLLLFIFSKNRFYKPFRHRFIYFLHLKNTWEPLIISEKGSILDFWKCFEYASCYLLFIHLICSWKYAVCLPKMIELSVFPSNIDLGLWNTFLNIVLGNGTYIFFVSKYVSDLILYL